MKSNNIPNEFQNMGEISTYVAGVGQSTAYRLLKKFTEDSLKPHGITTMQWFIIGTIYDAGAEGITVTKLSKAVDTNVPYITNTLNILELKDIVIRDTNENDSRSKRVVIHPSFEKKVTAIESDLRRKMRASIYATITPEELVVYINVLRKINRSL